MIVIDGFFSQEECRESIEIIDKERHTYHVALHKDRHGLLAAIGARLGELGMPFFPVGDRITLGYYAKGEFLERHADHCHQGGTHSILIYLNEVRAGGNTVFDDAIVIPEEGKAIIFGIYDMHEADKVLDGEKYVISCEVVSKIAE